MKISRSTVVIITLVNDMFKVCLSPPLVGLIFCICLCRVQVLIEPVDQWRNLGGGNVIVSASNQLETCQKGTIKSIGGNITSISSLVPRAHTVFNAWTVIYFVLLCEVWAGLVLGLYLEGGINHTVNHQSYCTSRPETKHLKSSVSLCVLTDSFCSPCIPTPGSYVRGCQPVGLPVPILCSSHHDGAAPDRGGKFSLSLWWDEASTCTF